jgi:hypothetical protein
MAQLDMAYLEQFIPKEEETVAESAEPEPKKKSKKSKANEETKAE